MGDGPYRGNSPQYKRIARPAEKIARLLGDVGIKADYRQVELLLTQSWDELSLYAHAIHRQLGATVKETTNEQQ